MFTEHYPEEKLAMWPVGIDVEKWTPERPQNKKPERILVYDKVLWNQEERRERLVEPIRHYIEEQDIEVETLRYGNYFPEDLRSALQRCRAVVYFCEHETQGIAYQQMLAAGVPICAWDRQSYWEDPNFFPDRVQYRPVSPVPYWDERCGMKFENTTEFRDRFGEFWEQVHAGAVSSREYILENLTLEKCARHYASLTEEAAEEKSKKAPPIQ